VDECLSLKSGDAELEKLRGQLQAREEKNAAQVANVIEKAQGLREECRFEAASNALGKIPVELMTQEASDLLEDYDSLAGQRETAMRSLKHAMAAEAYGPGLAKAKEYRDSLEERYLEDEEFSRAFAACQRALKDEREAEEVAERRRALIIKLSVAEEVAERRRALIIKLSVAGAAVTAVVLLIAADAVQRAEARADAVQRAEARITEPQAEATRRAGSFKLIPAGTFMMGDANGDDNETPHHVTLTKGFELGVCEVTQEQYERVMGTNPSDFKGPQNPVEGVSRNDAVEFCRKLSAENSSGYVYRLPTEAEWEYACRAGTQTKYNFGDSDAELGDYAWYAENSGETTHPVGGKKPNAWGLYDMHGNVREWCQDRYSDYPSRSVNDPTGAVSGSGSFRVVRGGCWYSLSDFCRSAYRLRYTPDYRSCSLGFRVLRSSIK
jgi:formylglycine-generating enzyme required for sulfatase activity